MNKLFPELEPEFDANDNKKFKVEVIRDNTIYANKAKRYLSGLYYLISWKGYLKEKNT